MTSEKLAQIAAAEREKQSQLTDVLNVCVASGCLASKSDAVKQALEKEVADRDLRRQCQVKGVGCLGLCAEGPLVSTRSGALYRKVRPIDAPEVVDHIASHPVSRLRLSTEIPFFQKQKKIVLENCGVVDPERIGDYIAAGGYSSLLHVLQRMSPSQIIQEVTTSGLRGRGGAGYPTGLKWSTVAKSVGTQKYVICNADEGDPGAFMDRSVLESDPHRVIEGMIIAAFAVGASEGYIYIRAEYPVAIRRLRIAIPQAEQLGLLGANIGGTQFSLRMQIRVGAGAYVCGEETALIASIEGKRGSPRPRPPYPAMEGLLGQPTLINNVETYANIPSIIRHGGAWYAGIGTEKSKGTKVFSLTGQIRHTGVVEVPMGITLREMVYEIGGGIPQDRKFKAVQTGGPSGGCIPEEFLDTPVEYE
jgi:bidirectional [NiFe] hydrogenase diaphorase subunit